MGRGADERSTLHRCPVAQQHPAIGAGGAPVVGVSVSQSLQTHSPPGLWHLPTFVNAVGNLPCLRDEGCPGQELLH